MYTKDKDHVIRIRVNEDLLNFIDDCADNLGITRSHMVRFMLLSFKADYDELSDTSYYHD